MRKPMQNFQKDISFSGFSPKNRESSPRKATLSVTLSLKTSVVPRHKDATADHLIRLQSRDVGLATLLDPQGEPKAPQKSGAKRTRSAGTSPKTDSAKPVFLFKKEQKKTRKEKKFLKIH